jgi:hypothetical protein
MKQLSTLLLLLLLGNILLGQQAADAVFVSADTIVNMELRRVPNAVDVSLVINNAVQYEYIMLEKSAEPYSGFKQCRYVECNAVNKDGNLQLTRRDMYPISCRQNAYYRVKTISKDGFMRIYPAICLPPLLEKASAFGL